MPSKSPAFAAEPLLAWVIKRMYDNDVELLAHTLLRLVRLWHRHRPVRDDPGPVANPADPQGPFAGSRKDQVGDMLIFVPRSLESYLIDTATGRYGYSHVAIDCGGKDGSINQCANVTRNAGRMVVTAIQHGIDTPVNLHTMRRKEMTVFHVRRSNHESAAALVMLAEHAGRFAKIVTHTRPLDQISRVFAQLENYEDGVGKVVIT